MSDGHHGSHEAHPPVEVKKPKPEPILEERKGETLDVANEAIAAAKACLGDLLFNFENLFRTLELEGMSESELENFANEMANISNIVEGKVQKVQEQFDIPDAMKDLFNLNVQELATKKNHLEIVRDAANERNKKLTSELQRKGEFERREHRQKQEFMGGIEKSGIDETWLFDAIKKTNDVLISGIVGSVIRDPSEREFSPGTKKKIEEMKKYDDGYTGLTPEWAEVSTFNRDTRDDVFRLDEEESTIDQRFLDDSNNRSEKYKQLEKEWRDMNALLSDPARVDLLKSNGKLVEARGVRQEAYKLLEKLHGEELEAFRKKEKERIKSERNELLKRINQKETTERDKVRLAVQKDIPDKILREAFRSPDLNIIKVSKELAERILKEKGGVRGVEMDLVFSLPESVLDAMVDTLTYAEIAEIVLISKVKKDDLPPIYWSNSFEKKIKSLGERFTELEKGSLFYVSEHLDNATPEQKREFEKKQAEFIGLRKDYDTAGRMGKYKEEKIAVGKYNDFFVPEIMKLMEMKRIREVLCGQIDEFGDTRLTVSGDEEIALYKDVLFNNGKAFPDSQHNTSSAPLTHHLRYGFSAAESLQPETLGSVDFQKAIGWFKGLYNGQVVAKDKGREKPIVYMQPEADGIREQAKQFDVSIEESVESLKNIVEDIKNSFESEIEGYENSDPPHPRSQLKELKEKVVKKTKEIDTQFREAAKKETVLFPDSEKKPVAYRQLLEAKKALFIRSIQKLQDNSYRPVERIVGMTKEDFEKGKKFFDERSQDLEKELSHFEASKQALAEELKDKKEKLPVLEKVIHDNVMTDPQFSFWRRKQVGKIVEIGRVEVVDETGYMVVVDGYVEGEALMTKKQFEALKMELYDIKERVFPKKEGKKSQIEMELENLAEAHVKRKQDIQKDIDEMLRLFPLIAVTP